MALQKGVGSEAMGAVKQWIDQQLAGKAASAHSHVCTDITDLETKLGEYAKKSDIVNVYKWKGICTWAELIAKSDAAVGDVWSVTDKGGMNYGCTVAATAGESSWDALGSITNVDLSGYYTISQIDTKTSELNAAIATKANSADVYKKTETYSKGEVDGLLPQEMTAEEVLSILNGTGA